MNRTFKKITVYFLDGTLIIYKDAEIIDAGNDLFNVVGTDELNEHSLTQSTWKKVKEIKLEV